MNNNKNGLGIRITLWIFGAIVFPVLFFMAQGIIANDRLRADEDHRIEQQLRTEQLRIQTDQAITNKEITKALTDICIKLARIEEKIENNKSN